MFSSKYSALSLSHHLRQTLQIFSTNSLFLRIVISATFGSMIAGQALSFTPDFLSAKLAAGRLFKLFDTESAIDVNDTGGVIKVKKNYHGDI